MDKKDIIMFSVGGIEIVAGILFLFIAQFPVMAILFIISGALFIASGVLTRKGEMLTVDESDNEEDNELLKSE